MRSDEVVERARWAMEVCNACRFCDGYCAVFQAMKARRHFGGSDLLYLANLCHDCRNCHRACQYAPPHEFAVNVPQSLADLRRLSYRDHARPRILGRLYEESGWVIPLATLASIAWMFALILLWGPQDALSGLHEGPGAFYRVVPWGVMVAMNGVAAGWSVTAIGMSVRAFWRGLGRCPPGADILRAVPDALRHALTLRYLDGGGHGCHVRGDSFSQARRCLHHAMFYGLASCFAATAVATLYEHLFGWQAPYAVFSVPVLLGLLGGCSALVGVAGLAVLRGRRGRDGVAVGHDGAFPGLLLLVMASGLSLCAFRGTAAMSVLLAVHLGVVQGFFLTLPCSKFLHGPFRAAALLRFTLERRATAPCPKGPGPKRTGIRVNGRRAPRWRWPWSRR